MALARELTKPLKLCNSFDFCKVSSIGCLQNSFSLTCVRTTTTKHWNPKWKWHRMKKIHPVKLPHTEEYKELMKHAVNDLKIYPRYWKARPLTLTTAGSFFEVYQPPEGDGKTSKIKGSLANLPAASKAKLTDTRALRKVKSYEPNFSKEVFLQEAHDIYVKAHTVLMEKDPDELVKYVTESALQQMIDGIKNKTIRWKFIESLEPPSLVQARTNEVLLPKYLFSQITVRFHTKQSLAIYDRFGRLIHGSEVVPKDVLEYVVFEKHINNEYGVWRLHGKIIPEWRESTALTKTYRVPEPVEEEEDDVFVEEDHLSQVSTETIAVAK